MAENDSSFVAAPHLTSMKYELEVGTSCLSLWDFLSVSRAGCKNICPFVVISFIIIYTQLIFIVGSIRGYDSGKEGFYVIYYG